MLLSWSLWGIDASTWRAPVEGPDHFTLSITDYHFFPSYMTWHVGPHITLTLVNNTQSHPGKEHEFIIELDPAKETNGFGIAVTGDFGVNIFKDVTVGLISGHGLVKILDQQRYCVPLVH